MRIAAVAGLEPDQDRRRAGSMAWAAGPELGPVAGTAASVGLGAKPDTVDLSPALARIDVAASVWWGKCSGQPAVLLDKECWRRGIAPAEEDTADLCVWSEQSRASKGSGSLLTTRRLWIHVGRIRWMVAVGCSLEGLHGHC